MNEKNLNVKISEEMEKKLLRYCTVHGIKKADAVRRAITDMLSVKRKAPPYFDPDVPL